MIGRFGVALLLGNPGSSTRVEPSGMSTRLLLRTQLALGVTYFPFGLYPRKLFSQNQDSPISLIDGRQGFLNPVSDKTPKACQVRYRFGWLNHGYLEKMDMNQDVWVFKIGVTSK